MRIGTALGNHAARKVTHPTTLTSNPHRNHRPVDPKPEPDTTHDHRKTRRHVPDATSTTADGPNIPHLLTRSHTSSIFTVLARLDIDHGHRRATLTHTQ